jgi:hydrogenase nickel incorporation protein HypB
VPVDVHERILSQNDARAAHNREHFEAAGVLAINLMGSPGAGKTAILEATASRLTDRRVAAVSGDLATDNDAERLRAAGIPSASITTGSTCHLDAALVHRALHDLAWREADYFFIENVGNLVCPAVYDLGQALNVVALSVTEGVDKPEKYPVMFRTAQLVLLTKTDLLAAMPEISVEQVRHSLAHVMPEATLLPISARSGEGVPEWIAWLERQSNPAATADAARA